MIKYSNMNILLENTPVTYYWLGFLMADGSFNGYRLVLELGLLDSKHLQKFAKFIAYNKVIKNNRLAVMDTKPIKLLRKKFNIQNNKTIHPCNLTNIKDNNLFISWAIGFMDGDGGIYKQIGREDCQLKIKTHVSWKENLQLISNRLSKIAKVPPPVVRINSYGYATLNLCNSILLKYLKNKINELHLPILDRKWSLIDLNYISRVEQAKINLVLIKKLLSKNYKHKDIALKVGVSEFSFCNTIRRKIYAK